MAVETIRHLDVFSPDKFGARQIDVIGVGAVGSRVAIGLAKLGLEKIRVWDFDKIEAHNIANQAYGIVDIGKLKVEALKDIIKRDCGIDIDARAEKVDGTQKLGNIVFLCPDTMKARKEIWDKSIKYKMIDLMVEGRMGKEDNRIYSIEPTKRSQVLGWEKCSEYGDEQAEVSACGSPISVGPTAEITAAMMVWRMISWFQCQIGESKDPLANEIITGLNPPCFVEQVFK